jgi:hypothetical protein
MHRIYGIPFAEIYPLYVKKLERRRESEPAVPDEKSCERRVGRSDRTVQRRLAVLPASLGQKVPPESTSVRVPSCSPREPNTSREWATTTHQLKTCLR